jgi:hypothetical protein
MPAGDGLASQQHVFEHHRDVPIGRHRDGDDLNHTFASGTVALDRRPDDGQRRHPFVDSPLTLDMITTLTEYVSSLRQLASQLP